MWTDLDLSNAFGSNVIFAYGLFQIILKNESYSCKDALVKVRDGSQKAVTNGDGDSRIRIAFASGRLYKEMVNMGYSEAFAEWCLLEDRKYVYACVPIAKIWGIKNKIEAAKNIFQIHNSIKLWVVVFPLIFIPEVIYIPLYNLRKK